MNLLHLSDIHFGRNNPAYGLKDSFDRHDQILNELIELIAGFGEELRPEHILFTGDIAWMGKPEEFREAVQWFRRLLDACGLTGKDISFCVGNHDLDLTCTFGKTDLTSNQIHQIDELYRYKNLQKLDPYLSAYNDFCKELGVEPYAYPCEGALYYSYSMGYKDVTFTNQKTIRLIAMNTAMLMTQPGIPQDRMWLGREQLRSLGHYGLLPAGSDIWYTIGLFHHPDRFLHPNETNTYDGRAATLPLFLKFADLLLCGHSESCGRSRISHQPGGGSMLLGGAAYYSDTHINSFSMIYISDTKRKMAYIPYVYENGWVDYDFYRQELTIPKLQSLPDEGIAYENVSIICRSEKEELRIPCDSIFLRITTENETIRYQLNNKKDFQNSCSVQADWFADSSDICLRISLNQSQKYRVSCLHSYLNYLMFFKTCIPKQFELHSSDSRILFSFTDCQMENAKEFASDGYSIELLNDLKRIEEFFNLRFVLPEFISEKELYTLSLLKNLMEQGFCRLPAPAPVFPVKYGKSDFEQVVQTARKRNAFCFRYDKTFSFSLLGVTIQLDHVVLLKSTYHLDLEDAAYKLRTFCDGDIRECRFTADTDSIAYLTRDEHAMHPQEISCECTIISNPIESDT